MKAKLLLLLILILLLSGCNDLSENKSEQEALETAEIPSDTTPPMVTQQFEVLFIRDHRLGDSLEDVIEKEGEPDRDIEHDDVNYAYTIIYDEIDIFGYKSEVSFSFLNENLHDVLVNISKFDSGSTLEERYNYFRNKLVEMGGEPDDEMFDDEIIGLWINVESHYAMTLYSSYERLSFGIRGEPRIYAEVVK